jgi:hypothetical protein
MLKCGQRLLMCEIVPIADDLGTAAMSARGAIFLWLTQSLFGRRIISPLIVVAEEN